MKLLLDTQVMKAWLTGATDRLSAETIALLMPLTHCNMPDR